MAYGRKWKPSKTKAREFAKQMEEIDNYCVENAIDSSFTNDSYYFMIDGQEYRVSNHTVEASNRKAKNWLGEQVREQYHPEGEKQDVIYITASKTRIIEIHKALLAGKKLNRRGYEVKEYSKTLMAEPARG